MGRKFTVKLTPNELASKVADALIAKDDEDYNPIDDPECWGNPRETYSGNDIKFLEAANHLVYYNIGELTPKVEKDLSKVEFSTENVEWIPSEAYIEAEDICGFKTLSNGLTYMGVTAGGDWETPIFFIIYFDGKELRGYIPKSGNTWNKKIKSAVGNNEDADWDLNVDSNAIIEDIQARIQFQE